MKKIFIVLFTLFLLASCGDSKSVEEAKRAMLEGETTVANEVDSTANSESEEVVSEADAGDDDLEEVANLSPVTIESLDETSLLNFDAISNSDIQDGEVEISGSTLGEVDQITVSFSNSESNYPDDLYTLKTFKAGGESFKYLASSKFQVLDFGTNVYEFTAYTGRETTRERITIVLADEKTEVGEVDKLVGTEVSAELASLPTGGSYGNPVMLGEDAFTYSDINGLAVQKLDTREISCENLTDYLSDNINTWFYWNTCRDFLKDKAISFNVIRLSGEEYTYQKHYVDFINNFYGTYDIQTGTGVTKENIAEKNTELKELNDTFSSVSLVDDLFKDIIN